MQNSMLAPCGIDCAECDIYKAAQNPAEAERLAQAWHSWQPKAEASWFRCQGCQGDQSMRWTGECKIADCAEAKQVENCSQCDDFICAQLQEWADAYPHHQAAMERLKELRKPR